MVPHSSIAQANRSRSSVAPSCLPAMVNGGHGTPPASRSIPAYAAGSQVSGLATSPWATFQYGRLCRSVAHAFGSSSTASSCSKPASSSPRDCPPAPAHISTQVSLRDQPIRASPVGCPMNLNLTDSAGSTPNMSSGQDDRIREGRRVASWVAYLDPDECRLLRAGPPLDDAGAATGQRFARSAPRFWSAPRSTPGATTGRVPPSPGPTGFRRPCRDRTNRSTPSPTRTSPPSRRPRVADGRLRDV